MNWLNIEVGTIRRPEYVGADPVHRATWWNLMAYCAEQENGGTIDGCADWKCRRWQQTCGITKDEVNDVCDLWEIVDGSLVVWGYPSEKELEVAAKRSGGSVGGKKRAENARLEAEKQAQLEAMLEAELQRKRREENIKEGKGTEPSELFEIEPKPPKEKKDRSKGTISEVVAFTEEIGMTTQDGAHMFHAWEANGWTNGGRPVKNWKAQIRAWVEAGYMPSQKSNPQQVASSAPGTTVIGGRLYKSKP